MTTTISQENIIIVYFRPYRSCLLLQYWPLYVLVTLHACNESWSSSFFFVFAKWNYALDTILHYFAPTPISFHPPPPLQANVPF